MDDRGALWVHNTGRRASMARFKRYRQRRSGGSPFIVAVQTADVWNCDDLAAGRRLGSPRDGSILVERKMSPPVVVVREVASKVTVQRALVPDDDVIETLAPEGADPFNKRILPGRSRRYQHFFDAQLLRGTARIHAVKSDHDHG
jgi:hypothetical protein